MRGSGAEEVKAACGLLDPDTLLCAPHSVRHHPRLCQRGATCPLVSQSWRAACGTRRRGSPCPNGLQSDGAAARCDMRAADE